MPTWTEIEVPPEAIGVDSASGWVAIDTLDGYQLQAAVYRPDGDSPFPVVVLLHGGGGLDPSIRLLGSELAAAGVLAVAGCWFAPPDPAPGTVGCPLAPPFEGASRMAGYARAILDVARTLPGADAQRVGLLGLSTGAVAALRLAASGLGVRAAVLDSAPLSPNDPAGTPFPALVQPTTWVPNVGAPLLILHSEEDSVAPVQWAREFEAALLRAQKLHEAEYYEGPRLLTSRGNPRYAEARTRAIDFLTTHLADVPHDPDPVFVPTWRETSPQSNRRGERLTNAQWIEIDAPGRYQLLAAVYRPSGPGPFPVVVLLHGGGGFDTTTPVLGVALAEAGFLTLAGCWFSGTNPESNPTPPPSYVHCPSGPPFAGNALAALRYADTLVSVARALPGADRDRIGLVGRSRGAMAAAQLASIGTEVRAVVADSGDYVGEFYPFDPDPTIKLAQNLAAPLLLLHGTADDVATFDEVLAYEAALQRYGKDYEAHYYDGGRHVLLESSKPEFIDARARAIAFLRTQLGT